MLFFIIFYKWLVQDVANQTAQSHIDFGSDAPHTVYGMVADATRLGNPAKDYKASFLWKASPCKSTWLLAQDRILSQCLSAPWNPF